jgi:hypothetical protein
MFEESPVWAEDEFERMEPLMQYDPLPEDRPQLYVSVTFTTPGGARLPGCVSAPTTHFAAVFIAGESIYLNALLPPNQEDLQLLRQAVAVDDPIFPLAYKTAFHYAGEPALEGEFAPDR